MLEFYHCRLRVLSIIPFSAFISLRYCVDEQGERLTVLGMLLSVIRVLLSDTQPYRDFNLAQLRDIDALDKLLFMCKVWSPALISV